MLRVPIYVRARCSGLTFGHVSSHTYVLSDETFYSNCYSAVAKDKQTTGATVSEGRT